MNNNYLIPANAKKGTLIFNVFRPFDLILFGGGMGLSLIILAIIPTSNIVMVLLACLPGAICSLLVVPLPYYHNVLCVIQSVIQFYSNRRQYYWKGWCFYERFVEESKKQSRF